MLLSVQDLAVRFRTEDGTVHAVNRVSFDIDAAETVAIVGESGCGKSATSLAIMGLLPRGQATIAAGQILFDGADLVDLPENKMRQIRGRDIAMVFQDPMTSLNPVLTIGRQLTEALSAHERSSWTDLKARAVELLRGVGIPEPERVIARFPHQLSGGMRQRVMVAMALSLEPKLLIADEPTTALDVTIQAQVLALVSDLTRRSGTAVLLITHNLGVVAAMCQRVLVMYAGYVVESAAVEEIFDRPLHPYTVGLLHSLPKLEAAAGDDLVPIEGSPPDPLQPIRGCPFAPRCAWRLDVCWQDNPALMPPHGDAAISATHAVACHNPVTVTEALKGAPLRPDFSPAPMPAEAAAR
jgi:oligopeptide transport system ATP-binding protein